MHLSRDPGLSAFMACPLLGDVAAFSKVGLPVYVIGQLAYCLFPFRLTLAGVLNLADYKVIEHAQISTYLKCLGKSGSLLFWYSHESPTYFGPQGKRGRRG